MLGVRSGSDGICGRGRRRVQVHDSSVYASMDELVARTRVMGYYGGLRLLRATCKRFAERVRATCQADLSRGCRISYDSSIPFGVPCCLPAPRAAWC
jgi:hypothetical protein